VSVGGVAIGGVSGFLLDFFLQAQCPDTWLWRLDSDRGYSVRGAYQFLTSQQPVTLDAAEDLIWHRQVPLKVTIFAWRLLRDKLTNKSKFGKSRHHYPSISLLRVQLRRN
jgi:hypothetical protein